MKGYSYELDFPDTWRGARVYHARRLRKDPNNPLPGQANENPTSEMVGGREEWEVARILISKLLYGRLHYRVEWKGWDPDPKWWPAGDFKNSPMRIRKFHRENPNKPGPPVRLEIWEKNWLEDREQVDHADDDKPVQQGKSFVRRSGRLVKKG